MRLAVLFSGGKDSTYAAYLMEQQGHSIEVLVSILPSDPHSWMFHTPNLHLLPLISDAMGKKLVT
ncbi:MAG: ATPase, partial [Methanomassiliicoccales archaeon]|nr:ATPase [Methanomassiliicoccales archaeon]